MTLPACITLSHEKPSCPILRIDHPLATGSIALLGGHVLEWTPVDQHPVLYVSPDTAYDPGKPIRGGIPVCWPWFGPREGLPGHGCVRTRLWTLNEASSDDQGTRVVLTFASDAETLTQWSHAFEVSITVLMGATLDVSLHMRHLGNEPVEITGALHTYLSVGAIEQTTVLGLAGTNYQDTIDHDQLKPQVGDVLFDREVDRVYQSSAEVRVNDPEWKRDIVITKRGSAATVVWNPWIDKSKRLADLPDEDYHDFLCIEAANAGVDRIHLQPGGEHVLATHLAVVAS